MNRSEAARKDSVNAQRFQDQVDRANAERAVNWGNQGRERDARWEQEVQDEVNRARAARW